MNLYIKILDGKIIDHPMLEENIKSAWPEIDLDNLPLWLAPFIRVPPPRIGPYEKTEVRYERVGDVIKDVWYTHQMSPSEKENKIEIFKKNYLLDGGFSDWIFDEATCTHKPPVAMPTDGKPYIWVQAASSWVETKLPVTPELNARPPYPATGPSDTRKFLWNQSTNSWDQLP
jgi:hypothetical protein